MSPIIDAHMHIGSWAHADFLGRSCTVSDAIEVMGASGIDGAAMVPTDKCDNQGLLSASLEAIHGGASKVLWFFGWVRPTLDGHPGEDDLEWVRANIAQVTGLKIHPSLSRTKITDPGFRAALELADEHALVVLVHCGRWQEMASYRFAVAAAKEFKNAKFLLAHGGGDTPPLSTAACELVLSEGVDNVWFEFSGLREYWVIERNVARLGAERYLMGSDYCLAHPKMYIGAVEGMNLDQAAKERILGLNATELFGAPLGQTAPSTPTEV